MIAGPWGSFRDLVLGPGSFCVCHLPRPPAHCGRGVEMQARSPDSSGETRSTGAGSRLRACQTTALRSFSWRKERGVGWGALSANCPALEDSLHPAWECRCPWPCVEPWLTGLLPPARPLQAPGLPWHCSPFLTSSPTSRPVGFGQVDVCHPCMLFLFVEVRCTRYNHGLKQYRPAAFSMFMMLCGHRFWLVPEHSFPCKETLTR